MGTRSQIAFFLLIFLFSQQRASLAQHQGGSVMPGPGMSRVDVLLSKTKVVCVGRYLLDVPESANVVYGPASTPYPIERLPFQAKRIDEFVAELVRDAKANKSKHPIGPASRPGSKVGTVVAGINEHHKIIYSVEKMTGVYYNLQSVIALGGDIYLQERSQFGEPSELDSLIAELKSIAKRLVVRSDLPPRKGPGFCIDGAWIGDDGNPDYERVTLGVRLNEFKDVHLSIDMSLKSELVESDALEPRLKSAEEEARRTGHADWYARIKAFRRGERKLANWTGYEIIARKPPQETATGFHEFAFVSQGEPKNPSLLMISISFLTGVKDDSVGGTIPSLSDEEAIQVWDKLKGSIRPATGSGE